MAKSCFIVLSVLLRFTDPDYKFGIYLQTLSLEFQIKYVGEGHFWWTRSVWFHQITHKKII